MIDATHLKAHRTASSLKKGGNETRLIGRTKGGMNTKLHTLCDKIRHRIENLFAKFKDWRRIATRYDRCAHTFRSAIHIAATVIFWL
jgi:hypothetical protein